MATGVLPQDQWTKIAPTGDRYNSDTARAMIQKMYDDTAARGQQQWLPADALAAIGKGPEVSANAAWGNTPPPATPAQAGNTGANPGGGVSVPNPNINIMPVVPYSPGQPTNGGGGQSPFDPGQWAEMPETGGYDPIVPMAEGSNLSAIAGQAIPVTTANANTYTAAQTVIDPATDTVEGRIRRIIDENGPLQQMAETRAKQQMNRRGLINSSMAIGAEQAALYDAAIPIAAQDASAYLANKQGNTAATNTAGQFNANIRTQTDLANAGASNQAAMTGYQGRLQGGTTQYQGALQERLARYQGTLQTNLASINRQTQVLLKGMDNAQQQAVMGLQSKYQKELNGSQYATQIYGNAMSQISQILQDPNMDAASKQQSVTNILNMLGTGLDMVAAINGLDTSVLDGL